MENISQKLRNLLGAESSGKWVEFMDLIERQLPFLLGAGRPTAAVVQQSVIGEAGFKSWHDMIAAPAAAGGLAWNLAGWKQWRRAYAQVQKTPYLRALELSASQIVTLLNAGGDFPATAEALKTAQVQREKDGELKRINSLASAKKVAEAAVQRAEEAEKQLHLLQMRREDFQAELDQVKADKRDLVQRLNRFNALSFFKRIFTRP